MRHNDTLIVLSLFVTMQACAAPPASQATKPAQQTAPPTATEVADPMASFARMVGGEWKVTFASGTSMYDTYHWGPGNHSGRVMTHGQDAAGNPWRGLGVVYWHPGRNQLWSLGLNPYEGSVEEGPVNSRVAGDTVEEVSDLYQNGVHRKMVSRTTFDGPDKYHLALLEEVEPGRLSPLTEWDYFRSKTLTAVQPLPAENPPKPSERLKSLEPLIGRIWDATVKAADWRERGGDAVHIESTFEWIPYIDAIYARTFALRGYGEPTHVLDAYFYHHTGTNALRCLALSNWGGQSAVYEGDVTVLNGGGGTAGVQVELEGYEGDQDVSRIVRVDFEQNGNLHQRAWTLAQDNGSERTLVLDVRHSVSEMSKSIWYVFQDAGDNYWFGSDGQGVYRYDGTPGGLTRFTTRDGLAHDQVRGIQQHGPTGDILITTNGGVSKFDGQRFVTLPIAEREPPLAAEADWELNPDDLWLTGAGGPRRYDGKTLYQLTFPKCPHADEWYAKYGEGRWNPYDVWTVYKDSRGHMWFGTGGMGVCRFDGQSLDWMFEPHLTEVEGGGWFGFRSIIEDRHGDYWFCNTQFRYKVEPHADSSPGGGNEPRASALPTNGAVAPVNGRLKYQRKPGMDLSKSAMTDKFMYYQSIAEDNNRDLWMAPYAGGVWKYDGKTVTYYPMKDAQGNEITMFTIYKDNHGTMWVGTHEHGAYKFNGKAFERFKP